mmetsp:Transcript_16817/g.37721  ORF Transcript_16817/g.37721 Transcript_16817/m.37721 type:complete len:216 (+) Transcript_16817:128-775(+)
MDATVMRGSLITLGCACVLAFHAHSSQFPLPTVLEPSPGASNCTYSLLAAFVQYVAARAPFVRYTLGSGTLLGAMRNAPPGLLQWEHDIDLYVPARDAFTLLDALRHECSGVNADHRWMRCVDHVCLPRPIITPLPSQGLRCSGIARSGQSRGRAVLRFRFQAVPQTFQRMRAGYISARRPIRIRFGVMYAAFARVTEEFGVKGLWCKCSTSSSF